MTGVVVEMADAESLKISRFARNDTGGVEMTRGSRNDKGGIEVA